MVQVRDQEIDVLLRRVRRGRVDEDDWCEGVRRGLEQVGVCALESHLTWVLAENACDMGGELRRGMSAESCPEQRLCPTPIKSCPPSSIPLILSSFSVLVPSPCVKRSQPAHCRRPMTHLDHIAEPLHILKNHLGRCKSRRVYV
jgi:hypothetical protein